jgi:hypothetical protein
VPNLEAETQAKLDEYRQLREEKAADWRLITQSTITTLASTAAIVAAGLSVHSYTVIIAAPLVFYMGVLFMIQSARLQGRMIGFLAAARPDGSLDYEGRVLAARNDQALTPAQRRTMFPAMITAVAWWRTVAAAVGVLISLFPVAAKLDHLNGFSHDSSVWIYAGTGVVVAVAFLLTAWQLSKRSDEAREAWAAYWRDHVDAS